MTTDPLTQKSAIFDQFLRGTIDATAAASQIHALPRTSPEFEFPAFGEGVYSDQRAMVKLKEFHAAWRALDDGPAA